MGSKSRSRSISRLNSIKWLYGVWVLSCLFISSKDMASTTCFVLLSFCWNFWFKLRSSLYEINFLIISDANVLFLLLFHFFLSRFFHQKGLLLNFLLLREVFGHFFLLSFLISQFLSRFLILSLLVSQFLSLFLILGLLNRFLLSSLLLWNLLLS